ncbi:DUF397 domain-containing protein [Phytomonospora endophytica]|uniref:DUF397 domain-containing protein n=1 Tax=Phytomonospora endophytica TaxID=714109 RepID=A0A841FNM7_9ACTN|nr:DUF397 domain-containing protein [Phytomonospora endophytica]MBB6037706.1 hypothetical protein [Phytomonospora endophytica]GIG67765.1 hypothetical protein Pen01_40600 [Phytomonospora endophytica]
MDTHTIITWRRSSHSNSGGNCVEVGCLHAAARWRSSTRSSGSGNGNCVQTLASKAIVAIRDSKDCTGTDYPIITSDTATWTGFTHQLRAGDFDPVGR